MNIVNKTFKINLAKGPLMWGFDDTLVWQVSIYTSQRLLVTKEEIKKKLKIIVVEYCQKKIIFYLA